MINHNPAQPAAAFNIDQALRQAAIHHQAGQLKEAGELYRAILEAHPGHPEANHNMGTLAVQMQQPAAALPYFMAALEADPARGQYWLSYINALFQAGHPDDAREVLALARQQGLQGKEVDTLAKYLEIPEPMTGQADAMAQHASENAPAASKATQQNNKKEHGNPSVKPDKSARNPSPGHKKNPDAQEIDALVALFTSGRYTEAASLAQEMTERFPLHWIGWKMLGVVLEQMGRSADALLPMQQAAALLPHDAETHNNLGITLHNLGHLNEAEVSYRRALQINPNYAQAHGNLGATLQKMGRLDEAEASYRRAIQIKPDYARAHCNLGVILHDLGRLDEAKASLRRALQIDPGNSEAHYNLGNTLRHLGQLNEAEASYRYALKLKPEDAQIHNDLGNTLKELGRVEEAEGAYRQALQIDPDYAQAYCGLGTILKDQGRLNEAEVCFRRVLQIQPDLTNVLNNLGNTLHQLGRLDEAEATLRQALQTNPDIAEAHSNLGNTLKEKGRLNEAEASHRRALEIMPDSARIRSNLASTLHDLGRLDEAEANYRQALETDPDHATTHSNLLFCLIQNSTVDAGAQFSEHRRFGERFEAPFRANSPQFTNSRDPERTLKIGFVSGDLRDHAIASFIEPVLVYLSNYPQLSLHAYSNHAMDDAVTQRIREYFTHWNFVMGLSDAALAENIRADGIDILIDLSGHSALNRLLTFARKPAPIQASWMAYPGTTGLSAMDYFLGDRFYLPPGQFDGQFTEKIVYLPACAPFLPAENAPPVNTLPALSNGYVTFGSFNRLSKLTPSIISLWAQLLKALPDSRMLLGGMPAEGKYDSLAKCFEKEGIARERLSFHPRCNMDAYLRLHHQVDICLDTFPYNGGTTTLHALWMGVPTLTLAGSTAAGRSGASILGHAGLEEFIACDTADFIQKGVSWASNLAALSNIRSGLREHFAQSAMCQPAMVAAGVERALRIMWQRWCAGLPAESFEVPVQDIGVAKPGDGK